MPRGGRARRDPVKSGQIAYGYSLEPSQRVASSSDDDVRIIEQLFLPYILRPAWRPEHTPKQVKSCGPQILQEIVVMSVYNLNVGIRMSREQFGDRNR